MFFFLSVVYLSYEILHGSTRESVRIAREILTPIMLTSCGQLYLCLLNKRYVSLLAPGILNVSGPSHMTVHHDDQLVPGRYPEDVLLSIYGLRVTRVRM